MRSDDAGPALTRRRALALGAAAGVGVLLAPDAAGARTRSFRLAVPRRALRGGRASDVLRAPSRFDLVGVAGVDLRHAGLELRARRHGGRWSRWVPVGAGLEHAPDRVRARPASDPVWTGRADEVQLRARRALGGLELRFVALGAGTRRRARPRARAAQAGDGAPPIVTRDQWGAAQVPPRAAPSYGDVSMAFVHHTESANDYGPEDSAGIVLGIAKYHRDHNGWNDIGYNFLVDKYGQVFEGRAGGIEQAVIGAHAQGWNSHSTGIAAIGSFVDTEFPDAGMAALARLVAWKLALHGVPVRGTVELVSGGGSQNRYKYGTRVVFDHVSGHRDGCSTACPGDVLYGQLPALRSRAAALQPLIDVGPRPALTLAAVARAVPYGEDATFGGRLAAPDGTPLAGVRVSVQKRGTKRWVTVAHGTTDETGAWTANVAWRRAGSIRASARTPASGTVRSPVTTVGLAPVVEVRAPATGSRVVAGGRMTVRGSVRPAGHVSVKVERQGRDGRWRQVSSVRARSRRRTFAASVPLRTPGLYRLTARTGTARRPVSAEPVYVRAVRHAADVRAGGGGAVG